MLHSRPRCMSFLPAWRLELGCSKPIQGFTHVDSSVVLPTVNPLWGTTKAGKAQKRLAQACL